ncbi:MAG: isoprenyl transferase [Clostridia bacterium]|jgi:undecaprenyl diphosphate synthase|nr:isoprenyl transferase [Clostridia bacterium]
MLQYLKNIFNKNRRSDIDLPELLAHPLPRHIAIIMDGNGRWAKKRGLPRAAGHRAGMDRLNKIVRESIRIGIPYLTVYAFSTENWKRPREEINALMSLLVEYVEKELSVLHRNGVKVNLLGNPDKLPPEAREQIERAILETKDNDKLYLQIALNYGARQEIVDAVKNILAYVQEKALDTGKIDEDLIAAHLYTAGMPDPDLIIRPSGEQRLSNFLLWQSAYSEFWFADVPWPDFSEADYRRAIHDYQLRNRRYGAL